MNSIEKVKIYLLPYLLIGNLLAGCASFDPNEKRTVYSDLFPQEISRTEYYKDIGLGFYNEKQYAKAIEHFRLSLLHDRNNQDARYWLAATYFKTNEDYLALIELDQIIDSEGFEVARLKIMSDIYEKAQSYEKVLALNLRIYERVQENWPLWKVYHMSLNTKNYEQAFATLSLLEEKKEDHFKVLLGRYEVYNRQKNIEAAVEQLFLADQLKPYDAMVTSQIINHQFEAKDWESVFSYASRYSKYHPYNLDVSEKLSQACIQIKKFDEAIAELKKQKELYPSSVGIEFKIAHVLFLKRDFINAEEMYTELYKLTKSDQSVFYISQIHLLQNDLQSASASLESLVSWSEYYPTAQVQLARLEWKNNQNDLAINRLRRAQQLRPDSLEIYQEYGQYLIWNKNFVESIALLEQGMRAYPKDDKLRILAAYVHFKLNNMRSFKKEIEVAQAINPNNSEIYAVMTELWYEKNKSHSELEFLARRALELNTKNKNVKPLLAWALLQQDKLTEAARLFEEFYDKNPDEVFYAQALAEIYQKNTLLGKSNEYENRALALKIDQNLKVDLDYFKKSKTSDSLDYQEGSNRLPASLEQP